MKGTIVITSLVHEFDLPKNSLLNPFYDPEIEALQNIKKQVTKTSLVGKSKDFGTDQATDLIQRPSIDSSWENLVASGPTAVNLLGQVMVLSSKLDFSFHDVVQHQKFEYVKHLDSFRTTMAQVSHEIWRAFLTAHVNMDKLQLNMQRIPAHVKIILNMLDQVKSSSRLQRLTSRTLNTIQRIGNDCIKIANDTHTAFSNVINHLGEIIILTELSKSDRENRLRETQVQLNISLSWQTQLKQLHGILKEHYDHTVEDLRFAHVEYSRALARRPSKFERFVTRIVGATAKLMANAGRVLTRLLAGKKFGSSIDTALSNFIQEKVSSTAETGKTFMMAQSFSDAIKNLIQIFNDVFYPTKNQTSTDNPAQAMENILYEIGAYTSLLGKNNITISIIEPLIGRAKNLSNKAIQLVKHKSIGKSVNKSETDQLKSEFHVLTVDMKKIDASARLISDTPQTSSSEGGLSSDSSKMIVQITERRLNHARQRSEEIRIQLQKNLDEMNELVGKIAVLDFKRVTYAELLQIMREALRLIGTLRETWSRLVLFFTTIATQAEIALSGTLDPFMKQVTQAGSSGLSVEDRSYFLVLLKDQSLDIHETSHSLFIRSKTYVDMSNEFLMSRLAGLSVLLATNNDDERGALNRQLAHETTVTQNKVKMLIDERKSTYLAMVETERAKLKMYLDSLGGPSAENEKAIEEAVKITSAQ